MKIIFEHVPTQYAGIALLRNYMVFKPYKNGLKKVEKIEQNKKYFMQEIDIKLLNDELDNIQ